MNSTPIFRRLSAILPGLVLVLGLAMSIYDPRGMTSLLQDQVFDLYQRILPRSPAEAGPRTVYVDIGAKSAEQFGAWPWPRKRFVELVDLVRDAGASAIMIDMPIDENDPTSQAELLKLWGSLDHVPSAYGLQMGLSEMPDYDLRLATLLAETPSVVSFMPGKTAIGTLRQPDPKIIIASQGSDARHYTRNISDWRSSLSHLTTMAKGNGASLSDRMPGSSVRNIPLVVNLGGTLYPSNVLETLRVYRDGTGYRALVAEPENGFALGMQPGIDRISIDGTELAALTRPDGFLRLYFGGPETRVKVAAADLINRVAGLPSLDGKIVVIGVSANGSDRFFGTPTGERMASGAIAANAIDQILQGSFLTTPGWAPLGSQLFIFFGGVLIILVVGRYRFRWSFLFTLVLVGGAAYGSWWAFDTHRWLIDPALPSATFIIASFTCALMRRLHTEDRTRFIDGQFARRLSSSGLAKMHARPNLVQAEGALRPITSLVVGLRGFNIIADRYLEDPIAYADILNRFFSPMTKVVQDRNGMVDRTVGDTMYAVWNAPFDVSDHASKACDAALRMVENLEALNEFLETDALRQHLSHVPLSLSIGIDSGMAITGNMGAILRFDYGVLGEPVSFGAHLQRNARNYGPAIIVGEGTQRVIGDRYALLEIDLISTPRHPEGRRVYALLGDPIMRANPKFRALQEAHALIFSAYRNQRWSDARAAIAECRKLNGAIPTLYDFYDARISQYEAAAPGEHWNGSWFAGRV
ncbi:MAG: adenylate/guanylate cyclase domain-containing protein [Parvibaculum sp.]|nr:adenylate/guanylate cyclase domain-containing protein [Parvibaculum sp.]